MYIFKMEGNMKTLIVVAHPNLNDSKVNASWVKELTKYPEEFYVHNLYDAEEQGEFNILEEQKLVEKYDKLILQFPIYWFNCPPLMKKWLDEVFLAGWAYGDNNRMKNRVVGLIITAGIKENSYERFGKYKYTLQEILLPFQVTFNYMEANYKGFYAFYGAEHESTNSRIKNSLPEMLKFIRKI